MGDQPIWQPPEINDLPPPPTWIPPTNQPKRNKTLIALWIVGAIVMIGWFAESIKESNQESTTVQSPAPTTLILTTVTPTTVQTPTITPTTIVRERTYPEPARTRTSAWCVDLIDMSNVSTLIPSNWDDYCEGIENGVNTMADLPAQRLVAPCNEFWTKSDNEILQRWMDGGLPRDYAIGAIDVLWTIC